MPAHSSVAGHWLLGFPLRDFLLLMQDIRLVPTKLTLQKDAAELARLETQLRLADSHSETRSLPSAAASDAGTERIDVKTQEHFEFEAPKSALIASRMSSVDRKATPARARQRST